MIRGLLSDVHGVLYTEPDPVPGSVEAVARLRGEGFPHLFLTNSSLYPKRWVVDTLRRAGFDIEAGEVMTAVEAAADHLSRMGFSRVGRLCVPGLAEDLPGVELVDPGDPGPRPVEAVLVGDLGPGFEYSVLNQGFRWLHAGAELVAVARNRFYQSPGGLVLDAGPFVALLEDAAGVRAHVAGKPSPEFFRAGLERLGIPPEETAMVGDDLHGDIHPAMDLGIHGILVRTGKFREDRYRGEPRPADTLAPDFRTAVNALLGG